MVKMLGEDFMEWLLIFILEKNGILNAAEAKCWSAYLEGRLRKITLKNIERIRKSVGCFSTTIL